MKKQPVAATTSGEKIYELEVSEGWSGMRLDKFLVQRLAMDLPESDGSKLSREYLQKLIDQGAVILAGKSIKASYKVKAGNKLILRIPALADLNLKAVKMDLKVVFEDKDLLVIDKPAGLAVHAGEGDSHAEDSLVNGLLYHCGDELKGIGGVKRPGIVHRLDKNTSGLMVVAKTALAQAELSRQFKDREVKKEYLALVIGVLQHKKGRIEAPIGRSFADRKKMQIDGKDSKAAVTEYKVVEELDLASVGKVSLLRIGLLTGRTHQIRVHFAALGHALLGDEVYGKRQINEIVEKKYALKRQFLQAAKLSFKHPKTKKELSFEVSLAPDLQKVLDLA
ncbi:MAG: RluA family pseudouridine synthase [Candidatus Altimarinota bacterium]